MFGRQRMFTLVGAILLGALLGPAALASQPRVILAEDFGFAT